MSLRVFILKKYIKKSDKFGIDGLANIIMGKKKIKVIAFVSGLAITVTAVTIIASARKNNNGSGMQAQQLLGSSRKLVDQVKYVSVRVKRITEFFSARSQEKAQQNRLLQSVNNSQQWESVEEANRIRRSKMMSEKYNSGF